MAFYAHHHADSQRDSSGDEASEVGCRRVSRNGISDNNDSVIYINGNGNVCLLTITKQ